MRSICFPIALLLLDRLSTQGPPVEWNCPSGQEISKLEMSPV
jgi:hypothetical protein